MNKSHLLHLIGAASGLAAKDQGCEAGPAALQAFNIEHKLAARGINAQWKTMCFTAGDQDNPLPEIVKWCRQIAEQTSLLTKQKEPFVTLGGDHSCAIGTWSGVVASLDQAIGLIWIDAHMDAHTFDTTESGAIHGMPLASLLGHGDHALTQVLTKDPKLSPEKLCLIGVRSYEQGEAKLLKELGVKIFYMDDVTEQGMDNVMKQALEIVTKDTGGYGLSIDLDGVDPKHAPGVGTPVQNGLDAKALLQSLKQIANDPRLIAYEIAEYNPYRDKNEQTAELVLDLITAISGE